MFDDFHAYFYQEVVASYKEYLDVKQSGMTGASRDIRAATRAATALFHLREHLPEARSIYRAQVEQRCPDYAVLGDIANVTKHRVLSNLTPHGSPLVATADRIHEETVVTVYEDSDGKYTFSEKRVVVDLVDGTQRDVLEVLTSVMNFWQSHLHAIGIIPKLQTYAVDSNQQPKSRAECESSRLDFEIIKGLRFHQTMRLQRYNYNTGAIEPIDLTGSQLRMTIRPPPRYDVDVSLTHNATGAEYKTTITLSEEENQTLAALRTDAERGSYVNGLPRAQEALQRLMAEAGPSPKPASSAKPAWWQRIRQVFQSRAKSKLQE